MTKIQPFKFFLQHQESDGKRRIYKQSSPEKSPHEDQIHRPRKHSFHSSGILEISSSLAASSSSENYQTNPLREQNVKGIREYPQIKQNHNEDQIKSWIAGRNPSLTAKENLKSNTANN